jgi:hypothetical protein
VEPSHEYLSGADLHCPAGLKPCGHTCTPLGNPATGCGTATCSPCSLPNASTSCHADRCVVDACVSGWEDCDRDPTNGCEEATSLTEGPCSCHAARFATDQAYATIAPDGLSIGDSDWTFEAWVKMDKDMIGGILFAANSVTLPGASSPAALFGAGGRVQCTVTCDGCLDHEGYNRASAPGVTAVGEWWHLACERSGSTLKLFVNGFEVATAAVDRPVVVNSPALLGRSGDHAPRMGFGPMRFSKTARYTGEFIPKTRWLPDTQTVFLFLVREPVQNLVIKDEAGGDNLCTLRGIVAADSDTPCTAYPW